MAVQILRLWLRAVLGLLLAARMKLLVQGFEAVAVDMGVNLGGGDIGVAQHHLHPAQVGAVSKEMGGKGVAEDMGADLFVDAVGAGKFADNLPEAQASHGFAAIADEEEIAASLLEQIRATFLHVAANSISGLFAEGHQSFLGALAQHPHKATAQVEGGGGHVDQFRNSHSGGVEQVQHGDVAEGERRGCFVAAQEQVNLSHGKNLGQGAARFGQVNEMGGIGLDQVLCQQKTKKSAQARDAAGVTAVRNTLVAAMA